MKNTKIDTEKDFPVPEGFENWLEFYYSAVDYYERYGDSYLEENDDISLVDHENVWKFSLIKSRAFDFIKAHLISCLPDLKTLSLLRDNLSEENIGKLKKHEQNKIKDTIINLEKARKIHERALFLHYSRNEFNKDKT